MRAVFRALTVVSLCLTATSVFAQQSPLETKDKAVVQFDINFDKITQSDLGKQLDLAGKMKNVPGVKTDGIDPSSISRLSGALSLPDNIEAFQGLGPGADLPIEMFSQVQISDSTTMAAAVAKMAEKSEEVSVGGKKFMKSTDETAPQGMLVHEYDEKTIEMGTETYLTRADREVFSDGLKKAWGMTPDHAIRLVVDVEGMPALKEQIIEQVGQMAPQAIAYAELLDNINNLRVSIDLDAKDLLTLAATGKDEEAAEEFADGLDSLLMFAKMGIDPSGAPDEDSAAVMEQISDSLEATVEGSEVSIKIPHPEGLTGVLKNMLPSF